MDVRYDFDTEQIPHRNEMTRRAVNGSRAIGDRYKKIATRSFRSRRPLFNLGGRMI
jgi:hypothetical protein